MGHPGRTCPRHLSYGSHDVSREAHFLHGAAQLPVQHAMDAFPRSADRPRPSLRFEQGFRDRLRSRRLNAPTNEGEFGVAALLFQFMGLWAVAIYLFCAWLLADIPRRHAACGLLRCRLHDARCASQGCSRRSLIYALLSGRRRRPLCRRFRLRPGLGPSVTNDRFWRLADIGLTGAEWPLRPKADIPGERLPSEIWAQNLVCATTWRAEIMAV
jgi:hypothetical protein